MAQKLTTDQLDEMKKLLDGGMAGSDVARQIGCSDRAVYDRRQRWRTGRESTRPKGRTSLSEIAEKRRVRDLPMLEMVRVGRTSKQIGEELGLDAGTVRHRVKKYGMKCEVVQVRKRTGVTPTRPERILRPCRHKPGLCKSQPCMGHRFAADLTCDCGTSWHVHQRYPVECPTAKRPEPVSVVEERQSCSRGHPWTPETLYVSGEGKRRCRTCRADDERKQNQARIRKRKAANPKPPDTHCKRGHEYNEANAYTNPNDGKRHCRKCRNKIAADRYQETKAEKEGEGK